MEVWQIWKVCLRINDLMGVA